MAPTHIIAGLGNPGTQYAGTRHNAGFMLVDALAETFKAAPYRSKFKSLCTSCTIGDISALLLKPQTFMNLSGEAILEALQFYKIAPSNLIVVHDELDLPIGKLRVKLGGGSAGHNGLKSIDHCLGTANYWRVRLGIERPEHAGEVSSYVLSPFPSDAQKIMDTTLHAAAKSMPVWFSKSADRFQSDVARLTAAKPPQVQACDTTTKLP